MYRKYQKLVLEVSNDGVNWVVQEPRQYKAGEVIEEDSKDCGGYGGVTQNRWVEILGEYLCINNDKYKKLKKQYLDTSTGNWVDVEPLETMQGELIEKNSEQCGYGEQWVDTDEWGCKEVKELATIITDDVSFQSALNYNGSVLTYFYNDGTLAAEVLPPNTYSKINSAYYVIDFGASLYSFSIGYYSSYLYRGKAIYLPATETINGRTFMEPESDPRLQSVYLPNCSYFRDAVFLHCTKLTDVYLNRNTVVEFYTSSIYPYDTDVFYLCGSSFNIHIPSGLYYQYISKYSSVIYFYSNNTKYKASLVDRFVSDL